MMNEKYHFQKLTPIFDADISVYEEAISFALSNSDIKNIAISGAYSAGKSSVLESYKKKHENYRFVHISLAHFRTPEQENGESEELVKESVLEGKILNQLIHQIPAENIPQTNFRVKKGVSRIQIVGLTVFSSLFIGIIAFLLTLSKITLFTSALPDGEVKNLLLMLIDPYTAIIATSIGIVCSIVFIFLLIKKQKNKNIFRKISLQGNEIEIFEEQDDSYFDKYLNEVLYLFENVHADVIVFEDMDRFNACRIFERLREVNTLVNIQRRKEHSKNYQPLRFFYLLRDDIFISKDRTKFFDYIIPIVPIVDSSNSYDQFLKHLKQGDLLDKFDQRFLQSISLYVDDMRILKNIYNEFVVYIYRLNTTDLDWNKMMAMIVYKNLFPRDFSELQLKKGFVFELFEKKSVLVDETLSTAKKQIQKLQDRIDQAKNETLISEQELKDVYAAKTGRLEKDYWGHLTEESQEIKRQNDSELAKRKQAVQDNLNANIENLEFELSQIKRKNSLVETKPLKDLLCRENIDHVFSVVHTNEIGEINEFSEIKSSDYFDLLKFLIRNGYIDETYSDYMTYFYEDSMSVNDKTFLRRITDRRGAAYTYVLKEPKKVIDSPILREVEFEQEETLNFDLFECLLLNDSISQYALYLKALIRQIKETKNFDFVSKFYNIGKAGKELVVRMNQQWPEFFSLVLQENRLTLVQIRRYSLDTLYFSEEEVIIRVNVDNCMTDYISKCQDYLDVESAEIEKLVSGFSALNVLFHSIDYERSNKKIFDEVYKNNLYKISFENISLMLKMQYGIKSDYDIMHKNYTLIKGQEHSPLAGYISENMPEYIEIILNNCGGKIEDDECMVISLLNNNEVEIEIKKRYIGMLCTTITDIEQVNESNLWTELMDREIVIFSVSNFTKYFQDKGMDTMLVRYLNNAPVGFDFTQIENDFGEEIAEKLFDATVICNSIETEKYRKILIDLKYYFDSFNADNIDADKVEVLVDEKILKMNLANLKFVRDKYKRHIYRFIKRNLDDYLELQSAELFSLEEALQIITWDIDVEQKIKLLSLTKDKISIVEKSYSDEVNAYIISHNFEEEDSSYVYRNYVQYGKQTRTVIVEMAKQHVGKIIANKVELHDGLLSVLLRDDEITRNQKVSLFILAIPILNEESCKNHFDELGLSELKGIFSKRGGRKNYEKSDDITTILEALKSHGWIYEYYEDERNSDKYIVIKNKPRSKNLDFVD
ncbi:hypothetical protein D3Z58_23260 [Clostridiaceae bacterium]|nr:hypothetical protein [Clostridiaceae bacterium]